MSDTREPVDVEEDFVEEAPPEGNENPPPQSHDDELAQYGENVRKRIAELTARAKSAEETAREAIAQRDTVASIAENAIRENKALKQGKGEADKAILENLVDAIDGKLNAAKQKLREAHAESDPEKIAEATAEVAALATDKRRVELARAQVGQTSQPEPEQPAPQQQRTPPRQAPHPRGAAWIEANKDWYGKDQARTAKAAAADRYLMTSGYDPNTDDYWKELDRMVGNKVVSDQGAPARDQGRSYQPSTPSGRSDQPRSPGRDRVTLSASEVAMAKRLGLSPEAYAAAKKSGNVVL